MGARAVLRLSSLAAERLGGQMLVPPRTMIFFLRDTNQGSAASWPSLRSRSREVAAGAGAKAVRGGGVCLLRCVSSGAPWRAAVRAVILFGKKSSVLRPTTCRLGTALASREWHVCEAHPGGGCSHDGYRCL